MNFDKDSTFDKSLNLSFLGQSFPMYQKFVVVEHLKLEVKLKLKMDELCGETVIN